MPISFSLSDTRRAHPRLKLGRYRLPGGALAAALFALFVATSASAQGPGPAAAGSQASATGDTVASSDTVGPPLIDTLAAPAAHPETTSTPTAAPSKFRLYNIQDEKLLDELWKHAGRDGSPEPGRYQILMLGQPTPQLLLLRDGTQAGALPVETQEWMRNRIRADASQGGEGATRTLGSGFWGNFWNPVDWMAPYQWKTGLEASARTDAAMFRNTTPLVGEHYDLGFSQRPLTWLTTEVGAHVSRYGGGPYRNLYNPTDNRPDWNEWSEYSPWWNAAIGVPGIKWEVTLSNREFPEYFWLDPEAGEGSFQLGLARAGLPVDTTEFSDGVVMKRWNDRGANPRPSNNNVAHTLHLKAGNLRYFAHFDDDMYNGVIQQFMFEEIRAPFGQWAIGFITADGASHSRLRLDLFPWNGRIGPASANLRTRAFLARVNLDYRDGSTFRIGLSTHIVLDSPLLRPGETP